MEILKKQDITKLPFRVSVIVNSANPSLEPGGGVCGAIHLAAGPNLANECAVVILNEQFDVVPSGYCAITRAHGLDARYVIHAIAPDVRGKEIDDFQESILGQAYSSALCMARKAGAKSVALPLLGAGVYGWPPDEALRIAQETLEGVDDLEIYLCLWP